MIEDADPHEPNYPLNTLKLDWRKETDKLAAMRVRIYSVFVSRNTDRETGIGDRPYSMFVNSFPGVRNFYDEIAKRTGGRKVDLENFSNMFDMIMAICYREHGAEFLDVYEKEVRARDTSKGIHKDLDAMFGALRDDTSNICLHPFSHLIHVCTAAFTATTSWLGFPFTRSDPVSMDTSPSMPVTEKLKPSKKKTFPVKWPAKKISKPRKRKKQKEQSYFKFENLPKLKREDVTENSFNLNMLSWTPWQLAISSKAAHEMENSEQWMARKDDKGCKRCQLFGGKTNVAALYEISVQRCQKAKRYVLYSKFCSGFTKSWDSRLLGGRSIRAQIDNVLSQGCNVYIRRAFLGSESKQESLKSL